MIAQTICRILKSDKAKNRARIRAPDKRSASEHQTV
jgi:hypothetical protein